MFDPISLLVLGGVLKAIASAVNGKSSSSDRGGSSGEGNDGSDYPDNGNSCSGRWTQHDVNVHDNIAAGMAVKEDMDDAGVWMRSSIMSDNF